MRSLQKVKNLNVSVTGFNAGRLLKMFSALLDSA